MGMIMSHELLETFIASCKHSTHNLERPLDCIRVVMQDFLTLIVRSDEWLEPHHRQTNNEHYARHPVYLDGDNRLGLYVLVWKQNQWTPVHDHGTWGVVGVIEGMLCEHSYMWSDDSDNKNPVNLVRGGSTLLSPGSVTSFIPNPDHIHLTGNSDPETLISVHLYGHNMAEFNIYDVELGKKEWVKPK